MAGFVVPDGWVVQAYRYALDPTSGQERVLLSHAGAGRFAHNHMLALVKAVMEQRAAERSYGIAEEHLTPRLGWSLAALRRVWNQRKDAVAPWWRRSQARIGKAQARAANVRRDVLHKATTALAQRHRVVCVETLNAAGMRSAGGARKRGLNRALADAALAEIQRMLAYKTRWYGATLVQADRFYPSSKTCSACGGRKPSLSLADRVFDCDTCGNRIDRDLNAAINLARLHETHQPVGERSPAGSGPVAGRGATQETAPAQAGNAAGDETSTPHSTTRADQTGTADPQGKAA